MTVSPSEITDQSDASAACYGQTIKNPVQLAIARLESAFQKTSNAIDEQSGGCQKLIVKFMEIGGAHNIARRVSEASPYIDEIETIDVLCAVLFRLGYKTKVEKISAQCWRDAFLPCFHISQSGKISLLERINPDGSAIESSADTGEPQTLSLIHI